MALLAELDGRLAGHILLSRMTAPVPALGLAPVSVHPDHQGRGLGAALIGDSLRRARAAGWRAVFLLGEPDYYGRFGFRADTAAPFASPYAGPYFLALELAPDALAGRSGPVEYARAFAAL